jgi:hypothetical protein
VLYPIPPEIPTSYEKVLALLAAAQKYDMSFVMSSIRAEVVRREFPDPTRAEVFCAFAVAFSNKLSPEMGTTARLTLDYPLTFETLGDSLRLFRGSALRELASFRKMCSNNIVSCLESFLDSHKNPSKIWVGCRGFKARSTPIVQPYNPSVSSFGQSVPQSPGQGLFANFAVAPFQSQGLFGAAPAQSQGLFATAPVQSQGLFAAAPVRSQGLFGVATAVSAQSQGLFGRFGGISAGSALESALSDNDKQSLPKWLHDLFTQQIEELKRYYTHALIKPSSIREKYLAALMKHSPTPNDCPMCLMVHTHKGDGYWAELEQKLTHARNQVRAVFGLQRLHCL